MSDKKVRRKPPQVAARNDIQRRPDLRAKLPYWDLFCATKPKWTRHKFLDSFRSPRGGERGWVVRVNGKAVPWNAKVTIQNKRGRLVFGQHPLGYDAWGFAEASGGGAVTIFYCIHPEHGLLIGLVLEDRPNLGGKRLSVAGGFVDPNQEMAQAAKELAVIEACVDTSASVRFDAVGIVPNRAFFVADPEEGTAEYALEFQPDWLVEDSDHPGIWRLRNEVRVLECVNAGRTNNVYFLKRSDAIRYTPDSLARSCISLLLDKLIEDGTFTFQLATSKETTK